MDTRELAPRRARVQEIQQMTAAYFGVSVDELLKHCHKRRYVTMRWVSMWLCDRYAVMSRKEIAHRHKRDHATMHHAMRVVEKMFADGCGAAFRAYTDDLAATMRERGFKLDPPVCREDRKCPQLLEDIAA